MKGKMHYDLGVNINQRHFLKVKYNDLANYDLYNRRVVKSLRSDEMLSSRPDRSSASTAAT